VWERDGIICTGETYKAVVKDDLRQGRLVGGPLQACATPASRATPGAPSISTRRPRFKEKAVKALIAPPWN